MNNGFPQSFHGLCVGGPMNGLLLTSEYEFHRVFAQPDTAIVAPPPRDTPLPPLRPFVYRHVRGLRGEISIDFWVPETVQPEPGCSPSTWALGEVLRQFQLNAPQGGMVP